MTDQTTVTFSPGLQNATGKIDYPLTNDIVFHCSAQRSEEFLKLLVSAFSGIPRGEIHSVEIRNPIDYRTYADKEIILDLKVTLNNQSIFNFEVQLSFTFGREWWINRSLLYLCRCFDNLGSGQNYDLVMPSSQISIVKEELFPDEPKEFYAEYMLLNTETYAPYTSNFKLNVLYLNHIDLATQYDIDHGLVTWAELFRADTWEKLRDLIKEHPAYKEVAETMYYVDADTSARSIAEAHEKYLHDLASVRAYAEKTGREQGIKEGIKEGYQNAQAEINKAHKEASMAHEETNKARHEAESARLEVEKLRQKLIAAGIDPDE